MNPEYTLSDEPLRVEVGKTGGGTVGDSYEGWWEIVVYRKGEKALETTIQSPKPMTHESIAQWAVDLIKGKSQSAV
ncbi:hypothetical protein ACFY1P_08025 [Streptomyces sp. NPDC001407]|uniref:hypothetical protein n=1 Tax=Streptomyces sp. NPDC001407 TaxID=3364573 RepID=UPI0036BD7E11